ncbi:unnamed protein product [Paramecium primaurelia]|uniref:Uncharacterized protein n=1 Tax=Paramecium primaurelia TaxID=5886 RepID=A0A8S1QBT9_PARPR|nr:unnamed protein product [Paramecium primaurelia]
MRQKDTIYNKSHLKTKIKKPYDQRLMERLANKIQRVETPNQTYQNKIQEFYQTINQSQQQITQTVIESKLDKLHENYQIELKKREFTQKHIQEILRQQKLYSQRQIELYDSNFERPRHKEIEESYYKDPKYLKRKQSRLHDYQKNKYEKYWKLQPMLGKLQN